MKRPWDSLEPHHALRRQDAADYLGISTFHLNKLVAAGELTPAKIGKHVLFKVEQLHRFFLDHIDKKPPKFFFWNRKDPCVPMRIATQLINLPEEDILRLVESGILKDLTPQSIRDYLFENQWQQKLLLSNQQPEQTTTG